jgi:hypothetical protein
MAKRIIVLEIDGAASGAAITAKAALWADVPAARQPFYAAPEFASAYEGATAGELAALRAGSVAERVETVVIRPAVGATPAQRRTLIQQQLQAAWTAWQQHLTDANPWQWRGTYWDGSAWTVVTVS